MSERRAWNVAGARWLPWGLVGLALLLRLYRITAPSLWVDEMFTLKAIDFVRDGNVGFLFKDLHGPLYTAFGALFAPLLADEWLRLLSALAGSLSVIPVHAWARKIAGDDVAAYAALLVALSPFAVWYGQELRNYSFVLLLASCLWLNLESWRDGAPGLRGWLVFVFCAWLGLLANLTFLLFIVGAALALLLAARGRRVRTLGLLALAAGGILLLTLPWVISFVRQMEPQRLVVDLPAWDDTPLRGVSNFTPLALPYTFYSLLVGFSLGPSLAELHWGAGGALLAHLPALGLATLLLGGAAIAGFRSGAKERRLEWIVILAVVLGLASFLAIRNFKVYNVRYVSMLWPLLLLLVAWGAVRFPMLRLRRILLLGIPLLFAVSLAQHYWNSDYSKEDCRGAAEWMETHAHENELVVIAVLSEPFLHYYSGPARTASLWPGESSARIAAKLIEWGRPEKFWLVSGREWEWGSREELIGAMAGYAVAERTDRGGISIYRLERGDDS